MEELTCIETVLLFPPLRLCISFARVHGDSRHRTKMLLRAVNSCSKAQVQ